MTDKKFPAALPRRRYWSDQLAKPGACPECGGALQPDYHCYLMVIRERKDNTPYLTGNRDGSFCAHCPVVVLNTEQFAKTAAQNTRHPKPLFTILGIVDLAAVPEDKQHLEFGDDNPIPLVEFLNADDGGGGSHAPIVREAPKTGRNDPCSCGSGKKFKKCCGA